MDDREYGLPHAANLLACGRYAEAAELAARGLESDPDLGRLWLILAEAEFRLANFNVARRAFEHAALLVPLDAPAVLTGRLLRAHG